MRASTACAAAVFSCFILVICSHSSAVVAVFDHETAGLATSGSEWQAKRVRSFRGADKMLANIKDAIILRNRQRGDSGVGHRDKSISPCCERWIVVTTIFEPSKALVDLARRIQASSSPLWRIVIVGDAQTPERAFFELEKRYAGIVHFLSVEAQNALGFRSAARIGWNTFGRKNVGFLYAIQHCARVVYDMDDDNVVIDEMNALNRWSASPLSSSDRKYGRGGTFASSSGAGGGVRKRVAHHVRRHVQPGQNSDSHLGRVRAYGHLFNPYVFFENSALSMRGDASIWPRGFPLQAIRHYNDSHFDRTRAHIDDDVALVQSIADGNPDVDAIYRLVQHLPVYFRHSNVSFSMSVPSGTYAPLNAQALLVRRREALFGLLLPLTVSGRVADIWRSFVWQRVLHELGLRVAFSEPWVTHERHEHDYMRDFQAELPLYERSNALIEFVRSFKCGTVSEHAPGAGADDAMRDEQTTSRAFACFFELYVALFEIGVVESADVTLAHAWLLDVIELGLPHDLHHSAVSAVSEESAPLSRPPSPQPPPSQPLLFIYILSHHVQSALRAAVRDTWLRWMPRDGSVQYRFCIDQWTKDTKRESERHGDMMALGTKALGWGKQFLEKFVRMLAHFLNGRDATLDDESPRARFFLRLDTDAFLNLPLLVENLRNGDFPSETVYSGKTHNVRNCKTGKNLRYDTRVDECYLLLSADAASIIYKKQRQNNLKEDFAGLGVGLLAYSESQYLGALSPINEHRYVHTVGKKRAAASKQYPSCTSLVAQSVHGTMVVHPIKKAERYREVYARAVAAYAEEGGRGDGGGGAPNCTCRDMMGGGACNNEEFVPRRCAV